MLNRICLRHFLLCLTLLGLGFLAGCGNGGIAWLPDSSGFIAWGNDNRGPLIHYDLSTHSAHLVRDKCWTLWPAMSADGKHAITADVIYRKPGQPVTLQIFTHTLDGKEAWHSQPVEIGKSSDSKQDKDSVPMPNGVFSDGGDRLLVTTFLNGDTTRMTTIAYSLKSGQWKAVPDSMPCPLSYGSPMLPSGKGIFAIAIAPPAPAAADQKPADPKVILTVMTWEGVSRPVVSATGETLETESITSPLETSWNGDTLTMRVDKGTYQFDTDRATWRFDPAAPPATAPAAAAVEPLERQFTFGGTGVRVECRSVKVPALNSNKGESVFRIESLDPRSGARQTIVDQTAGSSGFGRSDEPMFMFFPSPDGKKLAIRYHRPSDRADCVAVIGEAGKRVEPEIDLQDLAKNAQPVAK